MRPPLGTPRTMAGSGRQDRLWCRPLTGLTPQVVVIVAALLFARMFSVNIVNGVASGPEFGARILWLFGRYAALLVMAAPMLIAIVATANLGPRRGPKRIAALTTAAVVATGVGVLLRCAVEEAFHLASGWAYVQGLLLYIWPRYALLGGMFAVAYEFSRREVASIQGMRQAELDQAALEREMTEARLQVLQAQIEPHFLFNTLANVRRLYDQDRPSGRRMLENLMRYFEIALPRMRERESKLGRECELVEAFLRIQQIRMGRRLAFTIDVPAPLRPLSLPPMMLLTLVENAIKHGLNPSPQGGLVRVTARCEGDRLIISVADTGVGFEPGSGGGTGLANIRARLAAQFGDSASLVLQNNELGGVTAMIMLPLTDTVPSR
jgi:signal transduction histidine kinase